VALERATGAVCMANDVLGRQGAVDLVLRYRDGTTGAVEVTTHAGPGVRRRDAARARGRPAWPDPRRPWWTAVGKHPTTAASLTALPEAVTALLAVPSVARRAEKVGAVSDAAERHLVVEVGEGGLPEHLYVGLSTPGTALPQDDPTLPDRLTHLWLMTGWSGSPLVGWSRKSGWSAHDVTVPPRPR
jgi:hypothetical protein